MSKIIDNLELWLVILLLVDYILATITLQFSPVAGVIGAAATTLVAIFCNKDEKR